VAVVFADTFFYIAVLDVDDRFHALAASFAANASNRIVTSEPVLVELLSWTSGRGPYTRHLGLSLIDGLRLDPSVTIVPQTHALFEAGLDLYRRCPDKAYSLTDCMSMHICRDRGIEQVLTHDRHFSQEGFEVLL
jgi:predicted nucleic acid-binding protein